ncbi:protein of unknown function [Blastococcus saxobsidens DD2]|uniref:Uncharacterized protein n=1 Tax=Blastococcus saxobsidens (strain DD2) TaxID=1146883 RepID=H6RVY5_BLASD|nr:protein of unknown function [Blastococcus saxobsidens DD2]
MLHGFQKRERWSHPLRDDEARQFSSESVINSEENWRRPAHASSKAALQQDCLTAG